MRRRTIAPGLILLLVLTSLSFKCDGGGNNNTPPDPVRKYAKALDDMAGGINSMIKVKRELAKNGRISHDEELKLTNQLLAANNAVSTALSTVKSLTTIDASNKQHLVQLFTAITSAMNDISSSGIPGISNPDAQSKLQKIFAGVTAALTIISALQNEP